MICGLLLVIPGLVIPTFTRIFIDDYLVGSQEWIVRPLLWFMAATIAIQAVLTWLQRYYLLRLETKLALGTSSRFFNHILRLPAAYFGQRFAGEIGSRVQINDEVAKIIGGRLATTTHRQRPDDLLRDADVPLRRHAHASRCCCYRPAQRRRGQGRQPRPHRRQPAPEAGPRQAAGHGHERSAR